MLETRRAGVKKAIFSSVLGLGLIVVLEGVSFVALAVRDGGLPSPGRWQRERERAARESGPAAAAKLGESRGVEVTGSQVIHPFLGFVLDPGSKVAWRDVSSQGFPTLPGEVEPPASAPRFVVAIFGGSVAGGFCLTGREAFLRELARSPAVRGKSIVVRCFAMGGYKQPQQLMALNYALSLGQRIDLAIELDGFNEVVLPIAENLKDGVYPFFPRGWSARVAGAPSLDALRLVGKIEVWKEERRRNARLCASRPLGWSPTCHLLWSALDRQLMRRMFEGERELASLQPRNESFLARGPAFGHLTTPAVCRLLAEQWARSSTLMFDLCRARGIPYFHFLQPNQYLPGSKPMSREERLLAVDPAQPYRSPVEDCYPSLIETGRSLAEQGVPFHNLTALFAGHPEPLYSDACCHYNVEGNRLLAEMIGRIVVQTLAGSAGAPVRSHARGI
jgi:hypothetical protein